MATPGDPFDTEEREEQRAEQRRVMRCLDGGILRRAMETMRPVVVADRLDRPIIEHALRVEAQVRIGTLRQVLAEIETENRLGTVQAFLSDNPSQWASMGGDPLGTWRRQISQLIPGLDNGLSDETFDELIGLAVLLLWADHLAEDPYEDARFASVPAVR
jgi:hypothetical protein